MKKFLSILIGAMMMLTFTACSPSNSNADKGNDGILDDAGNAVNDVMNGAEDVVDDMTGSNGGNNNASSNNSTNNK